MHEACLDCSNCQLMVLVGGLDSERIPDSKPPIYHNIRPSAIVVCQDLYIYRSWCGESCYLVFRHGFSVGFNRVDDNLLGQWLNFKLFGITYLVGKIQ